MIARVAQPRLRFLRQDVGDAKMGWLLEVPYVLNDHELSRTVQFCARAHLAKFRLEKHKAEMREWIDRLRTFLVNGEKVVWDTIHPLPLSAKPVYVQQRVVGERGDSLGDIKMFSARHEPTKSIVDLGA